jgi:hypothetical protein
MVANGYNLGLTAKLLSEIYSKKSSRLEYDKLCVIAGSDNVMPWSNDRKEAEESLVGDRVSKITDEYLKMVGDVVRRLKKDSSTAPGKSDMDKKFRDFSESLFRYVPEKSKEHLKKYFEDVEKRLHQAVYNETTSERLTVFHDTAKHLAAELKNTEGLSAQIVEEAPNLIASIKNIVG